MSKGPLILSINDLYLRYHHLEQMARSMCRQVKTSSRLSDGKCVGEIRSAARCKDIRYEDYCVDSIGTGSCGAVKWVQNSLSESAPQCGFTFSSLAFCWCLPNDPGVGRDTNSQCGLKFKQSGKVSSVLDSTPTPDLSTNSPCSPLSNLGEYYLSQSSPVSDQYQMNHPANDPDFILGILNAARRRLHEQLSSGQPDGRIEFPVMAKKEQSIKNRSTNAIRQSRNLERQRGNIENRHPHMTESNSTLERGRDRSISTQLPTGQITSSAFDGHQDRTSSRENQIKALDDGRSCVASPRGFAIRFHDPEDF